MIFRIVEKQTETRIRTNAVVARVFSFGSRGRRWPRFRTRGAAPVLSGKTRVGEISARPGKPLVHRRRTASLWNLRPFFPLFFCLDESMKRKTFSLNKEKTQQCYSRPNSIVSVRRLFRGSRSVLRRLLTPALPRRPFPKRWRSPQRVLV